MIILQLLVTILKKNEKIIIDSKKIILLNDVNLAHKIAGKNFKLDDKIIKFGVTIGLATKDIKIGEHVSPTQYEKYLYRY